MKIAVAGTGYVGLVTGVCLASKGHDVSCVDVDANKIAMLNRGQSPIYEADLEDLMAAHRDRLTYTTDYEAAYRSADVIFIGVGTPEKSDGSANLNYVYAVAKEIANSVRQDCVVAVKSTVPIGTNQKIESMICGHLKYPVQVDVVSNPEFLAQGSAVRDTLHASRIVIGAEHPHAMQVMLEVYKDFAAPIVTADRNSAEMIKYASNDFLAVKISYINEIANLCELVGADVKKVAEGMGLDPRIGNRFLNAGIGYGGSCFPKDTRALHWLANMNDYELKIVKAAIEVNEQQKLKLVKQLRRNYDTLAGRTVAILGLTFKPGTDDLREAPSLVNIPLLLEDGATVRAYDPVSRAAFAAQMDALQVADREKIVYCDTPLSALEQADA
ncbi:MAG TPA: UDP-glucose/GDP-mannose dehydrogenase family protein, partial [Clostridiaceae bacterium]|nr:UDP-glucose/GDP-mannose dehydrogenase family protein [Clostridiaceae bacterium]